MQRTLLVPPPLGGAPLAELKHWLAISNPHEDAALEALLRSALESCEAFTGLLPLTATVEERHPANCEWQGLYTMPVQAMQSVEDISVEGSRTPLPATDYELDISAESRGLVRLRSGTGVRQIIVTLAAGLAEDWELLPDGLRHGILRLAAHHYRSRENGSETAPPAAVAALWRPWRRMRVA